MRAGVELRLLVPLSAALACASAHAQTPACSPELRSAAVQAVASTQAKALAFRTGPMESGIPLKAAPLLLALKDQLARAADAVAACHSPSEPPEALARDLAALLHANKPRPAAAAQATEDDDKPVPGLLGNDLTVAASIASPTPLLLQVELASSVPCGSDSQLLLYQAEGAHWRRALRWSSQLRHTDPELDFIGGPEIFGDFILTAILPGTTPANWHAVVAHGTPWCTSRFSVFGLDVLAPSISPDAPRVAFHTARTFSRADAVPRLRVLSPDTFEFRANVPESDPESYERTVVYRYRLRGETLERVSPFAVNSRGFVAEWLDTDWSEAALVSDPASLAQLKQTHETYRAGSRGKDLWTYSYGPIFACRDSPKHFQVALKVEKSPAPERPTYFQLRENGDGYTMLTADAPAPDPACAGPDLMRKGRTR